jgi:serine/threonine protein kinase/TolB-like protein/Flp pilus assembly protein TadD
MEAERWSHIEKLFHAALNYDPPARGEFLQQACAGDAELLKEVQSLLDSAEKPLDFVPQAVLEVAQGMSAENSAMSAAAAQVAPYKNPVTPGAELGHYKILSMIGAGGMGEVYLAQDTRLRRKVAIKLLARELTGDERGMRRFEQEALAASALNHPNILTIYEFDQADDLHFMVSEFVEGLTLRQKMSGGRLDLRSTVDIVIQIANALAAAHASGIVHRDIKPENVIVRNDGIVKVLDFGIAKLSPRYAGQITRRTAQGVLLSDTEPGMIRGTVKYMSPEQARGAAVDARSDIFSLGSVMYELVTDRSAFDGETSSDVIAEILKIEPPPPAEVVPDLPSEIERIIVKALKKDRESRYQSAAELLTDLKAYQQDAEFQAKLQTPVSGERARSGSERKTPARAMPPPQVASSSWWLWRIAVLLVVVFAIGYFVAKRTRNVPTVTEPRSLAVLPFRNLNGDPKAEFLGFSLADEIITKLDYVNSLTVRPSSTVDKYRDQIVDPKKVAADLNVDTLLTGTFLKDGDNLRITAQLVDVKPEKIIWREAIDLKYNNLLTVQDQVVQKIVEQLQLNLSPAEATNLKPEKPISSAAYEDYLRGIDLYSLSDYSGAIAMLEKATALEPNYAPAWAQLGRAYTTNASLRSGGREHYEKAQAAFEKAIALNPALAEPRIYLGNLLTDTGRVEQAVPLLRSVLKDNPNNAEAHWELGYAYRFAGMLKESVAECEKARQNNPQVKISSAAINSYLYLGEYEKFLQSLPANDSAYILFYRGFAEYYLNRFEEAANDFDSAYEKNSSVLPTNIGKALSDSIRHENARGGKLLQQTEDMMEERGVADPEMMYKIAQAYAVLGDKTAALHMLRHSIGGGFFPYPYFSRDPLLQNIRGEGEFETLMNQAKQRHEQFKATFF